MDPLGKKPDSTRDDAADVVKRLRDAGHVAYFAGGCVRDMLLEQAPKDFDVATDAPPTRVREIFPKTQAVGQAFGVILVRMNRSVIEVATFRAEGVYHDGRRPSEVRFTTAQEDAQRRDFTINGLFYDPVDERVIDYVDGQVDLQDRILRAIGNPHERFAEDHLRLLRAIRFAARFDLTIEPATMEAILRDAPLLAKISAERIADELRRMLTAPSRRRAVSELFDTGLVESALGIAKPQAALFSMDRSLLCALPADRTISASLGLLAAMIDFRSQSAQRKHDLLSNLTPPEMDKLIQIARSKLKLSNDELEDMRAIARIIHTLLNTRPAPIAMLKRSLSRPRSPDARLLLAAITKTGIANDRIVALEADLERVSQTDCAPIPLLTGDHLIAAGVAPGPVFKRVLDEVYDAQLEDRVRTAEEAMMMARERLESL